MVTARTGAALDRELDERRRRFIDDFGRLYARYGLSLTFGRVFGLLLISDDPLSLDAIARALAVSKTGAHVAARELQTAGVARRIGVPGSRRRESPDGVAWAGAGPGRAAGDDAGERGRVRSPQAYEPIGSTCAIMGALWQP
jgi:hypothetical protein